MLQRVRPYPPHRDTQAATAPTLCLTSASSSGVRSRDPPIRPRVCMGRSSSRACSVAPGAGGRRRRPAGYGPRHREGGRRTRPRAGRAVSRGRSAAPAAARKDPQTIHNAGGCWDGSAEATPGRAEGFRFSRGRGSRSPPSPSRHEPRLGSCPWPRARPGLALARAAGMPGSLTGTPTESRERTGPGLGTGTRLDGLSPDPPGAQTDRTPPDDRSPP